MSVPDDRNFRTSFLLRCFLLKSNFNSEKTAIHKCSWVVLKKKKELPHKKRKVVVPYYGRLSFLALKNSRSQIAACLQNIEKI